jgi:hypothetical protein
MRVLRNPLCWRSWKGALAVAVVVGALVSADAGIAAGPGAFYGLSRAQHPRTAADALSPKTLREVSKYNAYMAALAKRQNAYAKAHGLKQHKAALVIPATARFLGSAPNYNKIYAATDTQDSLCTIVEKGPGGGGPTCHLRLSPAHPVITFPPAWTPSAGGALTSFGVAMDGITAVSFRSHKQQVTVPVKDNLWYYVGPNQANTSLVAHFANGHDERIYYDCARWSVVNGRVRPTCP